MNNKPNHLTIGELKKYLEKSTLPDDALILFKEHERKQIIISKIDKTIMNGKHILRMIK